MEKDIEILEDMRDNIYGAMQFEDDYQVTELEKKQFNALNLAIKSINRVKELEEENYKLSEKLTDKICKGVEEEVLEEYRHRVKELEKYEEYYKDMEEVNKKFIAVDKIKEKIEELKKNKDFDEDVYEEEFAVDILQDLLN